MSFFQFVIALVAGLPGLLAAIAAFYHSFAGQRALHQRVAALEKQP